MIAELLLLMTHIESSLEQSAVAVQGTSCRILATAAGIQPGSPEAPLYCSVPGHARQSRKRIHEKVAPQLLLSMEAARALRSGSVPRLALGDECR